MTEHTVDNMKRLTHMVVDTLRDYVSPMPVSSHPTEAVALLKSYLQAPTNKRITIANVKHLREQTFGAMYDCRTTYMQWVFDGQVPSIHIPIQDASHITVDQALETMLPSKKVDNNGWGKTFDISKVTIREAKHEDMVDHTTKGKAKNPSGKKVRKG